MKILVLSAAEVEALLTMEACIGVMERALADLARGRYHQPLRWVVLPPGAAGLLGLMPSYRHAASDARPSGATPDRVPARPESPNAGPSKPSASTEPSESDAGAYGLKAVGVFHGNPARGLDAHQGAVLLFSGATGELLAVMNGSSITAIRTAAVSGVATRLLAREEAGDLAIVGAGVQASTHLAAMAAVRRIRRVRIASRRPERARLFAARESGRWPFPIEAVPDAEAAVRGADIIVTATSSAEPVITRGWIAPGAHLNVVGSSRPRAREVDGATIAASRLFVDRRESTENEAGDYLLALEEGAIAPGHIRAEIGEILVGAAAGRTTPGEITLFKSLGLAAEDQAAAEYLYAEARARDRGIWVEFGSDDARGENA